MADNIDTKDLKDFEIKQPIKRGGKLKRTFYVNWNVSASNLEIHKVLGTGATCEVYKGQLTGKHGIEDVAVKRLQMYVDEEEAKQQLEEIKFLKRLEHKNIIAFKGVVFKTAIELYKIVTELASKGSLYAYLKAYRTANPNKPRLPREKFEEWCIGGASAIQFLQKNEVAHMDIKSMNFLITHDDVIKLCDFGIARDLQATINTRRECGTIRWMAPEVFKEHLISFASDIYSFAIVVWELLTCEEPFKGIIGYAVMWAVGEQDKRPDIPDDCPDYIRELLVLCWKADHSSRPLIHNVLACLKNKDDHALQDHYSIPPVRSATPSSGPHRSHYEPMRPSLPTINVQGMTTIQQEPTATDENSNEISDEDNHNRDPNENHIEDPKMNNSEDPKAKKNQTVDPSKDPNDDPDTLTGYWQKLDVEDSIGTKRRRSSLPELPHDSPTDSKPVHEPVHRAATAAPRRFDPEEHERENKTKKKKEKKTKHKGPLTKIGCRYKTTRPYKTLLNDEIDIEEGARVELIDINDDNGLWHIRYIEDSTVLDGWIKPDGLKKLKEHRTLFRRRRRSSSISFEQDQDKANAGYKIGKSTFYHTEAKRLSASMPTLPDTILTIKPCYQCRKTSMPGGQLQHKFKTHETGEGVCNHCNKHLTGGPMKKCKECGIKVHKTCESEVLMTRCCKHHDRQPPSYPPPRTLPRPEITHQAQPGLQNGPENGIQ